jgi:hypothetical protein
MGVEGATTGIRTDAHASSGVAVARAPQPHETAWLIAVPCAIAVAIVVVALGPALGRLLFPPLDAHFWPSQTDIRPEPTEHARYLLALLAPLLASAAVLLAARRKPRLNPTAIRLLVAASRALALAAFAVAVISQHIITFGDLITGGGVAPIRRTYFTWTTITVAIVLALLSVGVLASTRARERAAGWLRDSRGRRIACSALAVLFTATWMLTAINSDATAGKAHFAVSGFIIWSMEETFAVLNGRSPLVNYHAQYGSLWPYAAGGVMSLLGTTITVWTTFMATMAGLALLAVYDTLRRVARSSIGALLLYAPFVATGFFMYLGPLDNRYAPSNLFSLFPIRYGGPYVLAWFTVRHLDGVRPRRLWPIFLLAGLVAMNNVEFGTSAIAGTVAALLWSGRLATRRAIGRSVAEAASGLIGAFAIVSTITLTRTGQLPHLGLLVEFSRLYGLGGWGMLPMPKIGFQYALFLTYVAAIVTATARAAARDEDTVLTGMLVWAGVFGFGAGSYYLGNSHPEDLISEFSAWAFALALLVIVAVRSITARDSHRPTFADLAVLLAFGLAVCSLAQTPTPWSQVRRLGEVTPLPAPPVGYADRFIAPGNVAEQFVGATAKPGEHVIIMIPLSHRIAYDLGVVNVSPYSSMEATPTREQMDRTVEALRQAHGTKLYIMVTRPDPAEELVRLGLVQRRSDQTTLFAEFDDARAR